MMLNEFRIMWGIRRTITAWNAKKEKFFYLQRKKRGFFGKEKWVDFWIRTYWGCDPGRDYPEFETLKQAQKYLKDLKEVLKEDNNEINNKHG